MQRRFAVQFNRFFGKCYMWPYSDTSHLPLCPADMSLDPSSFSGMKLRSKASLQGSGSTHSADSSPSPSPMSSFPRRGVTGGGRDSAGYLEELEKER